MDIVYVKSLSEEILSLYEISNLTFCFENEKLFENLNEKIENGKIYLLTSSAGEGKTTFLKILAGLLFPTSGVIYYKGKPISSFSKQEMLAYHRDTGFLFQNAALINNMDILENLSLYYKYNQSLPQDRINDIIIPYVERFNLKSLIYNRPEQLSHSEQMLFSLIRAISHEPKIIFFDEPIETLDQPTIKIVMQIIYEFKQMGKTMIITTHHPHIFFNLADKISILSNKKIIFSGTHNEILGCQNEMVKKLLDD